MSGFNEKIIKNYTGKITYEKGEKLYLNGGIKAFSIEGEDNPNIKEINALVKEDIVSETTNKAYLLLNYKRENIEEFSCDCKDFSGGRKTKACKHIVAAYLRYIRGQAKLKEKSESLIELIKKEEAEKINFIKKIKEKEKVLLNLSFIIYFTVERSFREIALELMIGEDKTYKVSDAREFLSAVFHKNYVASCEGGFTFKPNEHYFNERDIMFLKILSSVPIIKSSKNIDDRKKLIINEEILSIIFQMLYGRGFNLNINERNYKNVRLINEDLPLEFELTKISDYNWVLKQLNDIPIDLTGGEKYYFYNNNIYTPTVQMIKEYSYYHKALQNFGEVSIKQSNRRIKDEIIPLLRNISKNVEIVDKSKEINNDFGNLLSDCNFTTHMYLDKTLGGISLGLKFLYKNIEIDMFSGKKFENAAKVKNRQISKESIVISQIKDLGFEITRKSFILQDEDKLLDFLAEGVDILKKLGQVNFSDDFKDLRVYDNSDYKVKAAIREDGLLEFSFSIKGITNSEFIKIINAVKNDEKYYKLLNGGYVALTDKFLRNIINLIDYLDAEGNIENGGTLVASKYNALYVEQYLKENEFVYIEKNKRYKELIDNINNIKDIDYTLPSHIERVMRPYQRVGFKWLKTLAAYGFGGILSDEMGLGKTLQAIAFIASEAMNHENPVLVAVPTSLVYNWEMEIKKFASELKSLVLYGSKKERVSMLQSIKDYDVVITSYAVLRNDLSYFKNIQFSYLFIDEAQQIKNSYTLNAKAVKQIKAKGYFALTGTPMENSLLELWSVFDFIMPGYLLSKTKFNKVYADPIILQRDKNALEALKKHIAPFMLRRLKREVMRELPDKINQRLVVEMTEEQKALYMTYVYNARNEINREFTAQGFIKNKMSIFSTLTKLRQICCDPSVVLPDYEGESGKMLALSDILDETLNANHRLLIFSQFTSVLHKIAFMLKQKNIEYFYLDGKTKSEDRFQMSTEFNEGSRDVFLVSLKAGGFGLNLTGADIVVHFDPWWNPAVEEQAADRAHRIGQTKTVEVIKLAAKGTIEEKIFSLQEKKKDMIDSVVESSNQDSLIISSFTEEDFKELFAYEG